MIYYKTIYFEQMVNWLYLAELQLNKANSSDTEAPFLYLNLPNGIVFNKIMINGIVLILILLMSRFLTETSLDVHHMAFAYLRFNIFKLLFLETATLIEAKFHVEPPW